MRSLFFRGDINFMEKHEKSVKKVDEVIILRETIVQENLPEPEQEKVEYAFVKETFFQREFDDPEEILDKIKGKQAQEGRVYVCVKIEWESNTYLVPLRRELGSMVNNPKLSTGYFPVPSSTKPNAGLDFRKTIIVNDESLYVIADAKIAHSQKTIMRDNLEEIKTSVINYVVGFKKAVKKNRNKRDLLYKYSALNNFLEELKD